MSAGRSAKTEESRQHGHNCKQQSCAEGCCVSYLVNLDGGNASPLLILVTFILRDIPRIVSMQKVCEATNNNSTGPGQQYQSNFLLLVIFALQES